MSVLQCSSGISKYLKKALSFSLKLTRMRPLLLFAFFLVTIYSFAQATSKKGSAQLDQSIVFDKYIRDAMPVWKVPGLSVAVVKDGKVVFKKGYGLTELGKPTPFDTSTISICASTTKAMTAVCVAMLVDAGKLKWSDKVEDIIPGFKINDAYATSQITVKDLLTHNAGLGNADWL